MLVADLGAVHAVDLEGASQRDGAMFELFAGRAAQKLVVVSCQLLTVTHTAVLRAVKVRLHSPAPLTSDPPASFSDRYLPAQLIKD